MSSSHSKTNYSLPVRSLFLRSYLTPTALQVHLGYNSVVRVLVRMSIWTLSLSPPLPENALAQAALVVHASAITAPQFPPASEAGCASDTGDVQQLGVALQEYTSPLVVPDTQAASAEALVPPPSACAVTPAPSSSLHAALYHYQWQWPQLLKLNLKVEALAVPLAPPRRGWHWQRKLHWQSQAEPITMPVVDESSTKSIFKYY